MHANTLNSCHKMESKKDMMKKTSVHELATDKFKLAYILHFFLGAGNLLPWNALITAVDYFSFVYPDRHVAKVFAVVYMGASLLVLVILLNWGFCREKLSLRLRLNLGFCMFLVTLMATPVMNWTCPEMNPTKSYYIVVFTVLICGLGDGLIGGSLIGTAGKLPKQYMQAIFAGTASSGVLISTLRIITKASLPQTPQGLKASAELYFLFASAAVVLCILSCNLLYRLPVMRKSYKDFENILPSGNGSKKLKLWETFSKIRVPGLGVMTIYAVTLSIFPGFLAEGIESKAMKDWYPIALIAAYNLSDFVGKAATAVRVTAGVGRAAWLCAARVGLYPLFVGCLRGPGWLRTEAPVVALTVVLGLSNGYLTSVLMILAPKEVGEEEAEVAAIVMAVMLAVGLVVGSVIGWVWII